MEDSEVEKAVISLENSAISSKRSDTSNSSDENVFRAKCHQCSDPSRKKKDKKRLIIASIVCLMFMTAEIVCGILANSLAIISDAVHLLSDLASFSVSLLAIWLASKPSSRSMNFGFYRAEVLGALISILLLWLVTGILVYEAVLRILNTNYNVDAVLMLAVSIAGILANLVMLLILNDVAVSPCCRNSEEIPGHGISVKSAAAHVIGDLLQSVGVLSTSIIIFVKPSYKLADPVCTILFSVIVFISSYSIMKNILVVLMEGFPKHIDFHKIRNVILSVPGVLKVHNLRMWSLTEEKIALCAHIVIDKNQDPLKVLDATTSKIGENFNIFEVTLQIEESGNPVEKCKICK